jgi:hypothetical protein
MSKRIRLLLTAVAALATTGVLVATPALVYAGIVATGVD